MSRPAIPRVTLYVLVICIGLTWLIAASTSSAAFGAYNPAWDGTSEFRETVADTEGARITLTPPTVEGLSPATTTVVIVGPTDAYTSGEAAELRSFVETGGTLIVADDYGPYGNALLNATGATARFDGGQLRDERTFYRAPTLPRVTNVSGSPYTTNVSTLTLNGGTAVNPGAATVVARTSPLTYIDKNATGTLSAGDRLAAYPVITTETVGAGTVVAIGDPSLFINTMLEETDNRAFVEGVVTTTPTVLVDYSQVGGRPTVAVAIYRLRTTPLLQSVIGSLVVIWGWGILWSWPATAITLRQGFSRLTPPAIQQRIPVWVADVVVIRPQPVVDEQAIRTAVAAQYPDVDADQLTQIITDMLPHDSKDTE